MLKNSLVVISLLASWFFAYWLGVQKSEIKYITQEKEVIRYEKNCAINILAKPSLNDDAIVRLFNAGKL